MKALLFSNAKLPGLSYLEWTVNYLKDFTEENSIKKILFIPFAVIGRNFREYESVVKEAYSSLPLEFDSLHHYASLKSVVDSYDMILVGGGNTYNLLKTLKDREDLKTIQEVFKEGLPYSGWSAGCIISCPNIHTTNDMPIVTPTNLQALNLIPQQINPHYLNTSIDGHMGETRDVRIREYLILNPREKVIGLTEGSFIKMNNNYSELVGHENKSSYLLSINKSLELIKEEIPSGYKFTF